MGVTSAVKGVPEAGGGNSGDSASPHLPSPAPSSRSCPAQASCPVMAWGLADLALLPEGPGCGGQQTPSCPGWKGSPTKCCLASLGEAVGADEGSRGGSSPQKSIWGCPPSARFPGLQGLDHMALEPPQGPPPMGCHVPEDLRSPYSLTPQQGPWRGDSRLLSSCWFRGWCGGPLLEPGE